MDGLGQRLRVLEATVRSQYGGGRDRYLKLLWYSLLRPNRFVVLAADTPVSAAPGPEEGVVFQWVESAELDELRRGRNLPREFYMDRTVAPSRCCLGLVDGEPAYIHWLFLPGDRSRFLRIHEGTAEINYILTLAGHRGRGLCRAAISHTLSELEQEGIRSVYAVVHDANVASLKALTRAGMRRVGAVRSVGRIHGRFDAWPLPPEDPRDVIGTRGA